MVNQERQFHCRYCQRETLHVRSEKPHLVNGTLLDHQSYGMVFILVAGLCSCGLLLPFVIPAVLFTPAPMTPWRCHACGLET